MAAELGDVKLPMHTAIEPEKTREAALLGLKLVDWYFGSLHHAVVYALNAHGRLSLRELVEQVSVLRANQKLPALKRDAIKGALATLVRQNCVVVNDWKSPIVPGREQRSEYLYELDMPRMLNMLRLPLFSKVLETTVPRKQLRESRVVLSVLVNEGRLGLDELVEASIAVLKGEWERAEVEQAGEEQSNDSDQDGMEMDGGAQGVPAAKTGPELDGPGGRDEEETGRAAHGTTATSSRATTLLANLSNGIDDTHLQGMSDEELVEHFRDMVNDLINRQLIEKAPACDLCPPEDFVHHNARKKKAQNKEAEGEEEVRENEMKVRGQTVRLFHSTNRFVREDTWGNQERRKCAYRINEGNRSYHVQMDANRPQDDKAVAIAPQDQVWRVNFQELNRRVYNGIAVDTIRTGLESVDGMNSMTCGRVVEAMLYTTRNPDPSDSDHASVVPRMSMSMPLSIDKIRKASEEIHEVGLTMQEIKDTVKAMLLDSEAEANENKASNRLDDDEDFNDPGRISGSWSSRKSSTKRTGAAFKDTTAENMQSSNTTSLPKNRRLPPLSSCLKGNDGNKTYQFDTPTALKIARTAKLLEIIEQRFGPHGKRIWNMLYTEGQMEQKAISQDSMLGNTRPREILYAMFRNGFVALQDIPRNADRAPSRTFYTWRATMPSAIITTAAMLYKSASNLLQMLQDIMTSDELTDLNRRMGLGITFEEDRFAEIHFKKDALVDNLLNLDEELALFQFDRDGRGDARHGDADVVVLEDTVTRPGTKRSRA